MTLKSHCQRRAPFLHRNWTDGVAWQNPAMGASLSSAKHHGSFVGADHDAPPAKRRRTSSSASLDMDQLVASPRDSDTRSTLRIEVLKVFHKDSKKVRAFQPALPARDLLVTQGSCRITILDVSTDYPRPLYCQSQLCDIATYKNPVGPHRVARIDLPRPFHVPEESILIRRLDDDTFDFSESYRMRVELEAANGGTWPPLDSHDFGMLPGDLSTLENAAKRHWVMFSEFEAVYGRIKSPLRLSAGYSPHLPKRQTDYVMDVELKWTTGFQALRRLEKGSKPCITAIDPDTESYTNGHFEPALDDQHMGSVHGANHVNGINGHVKDESSHDHDHDHDHEHVHEAEHDHDHDHDDEMEGDQTPTRSLRTREKNKVYNLKVLSDQAQGKERKRRARAAQATTSEGRVTYCLPTDQPVCLDFWRCISCGAYHQSMLQLQMHLQTAHSNYDYLLETTGQGPQFRLSNRLDPIPSPSKTYQLGRPVKPFNLTSFISGDQSWITSRLGLDSNEDPPRSPGAKAAQVRHISDRPASQGSQTTQRRAERRKILVPETSQPLFDSISKRQLKPGQELPEPRPDITWLLQKHRESIGDFTDVTPSEKEYIRQWDAFILRQSLTSSAYFPRAWLSFVRQYASWLVAAEHRMTEFGKHTSVLLARDVLDDKLLCDAFLIINEARAQAKATKEAQVNGVDAERAEAPKQSPRASHIRKNANGCAICQLPVLGPRLLVCSNQRARRTLVARGLLGTANFCHDFRSSDEGGAV